MSSYLLRFTPSRRHFAEEREEQACGRPDGVKTHYYGPDRRSGPHREEEKTKSEGGIRDRRVIEGGRSLRNKCLFTERRATNSQSNTPVGSSVHSYPNSGVKNLTIFYTHTHTCACAPSGVEMQSEHLVVTDKQSWSTQTAASSQLWASAPGAHPEDDAPPLEPRQQPPCAAAHLRAGRLTV